MKPDCSEPIGWARLVDYFSGDLEVAESDRIEEHLFGCEPCSLEAERAARLAGILRAGIPAVVSAEQVRELRKSGLVIGENPVALGTRELAVFPSGVDILLHRLGGLDLSRAERVQVDVRAESSGEVMFEDHFAPFDRERGEVLIACQRHFASLPADVAFDVRAHEASGQVSLATFLVPHAY
jgi:hypothetical protein